MKARRDLSREAYTHDTSTYIFKQDYILVTAISINDVSDFVVGPIMRNFPVTTARKFCCFLHIYLPTFFYFNEGWFAYLHLKCRIKH